MKSLLWTLILAVLCHAGDQNGSLWNDHNDSPSSLPLGHSAHSGHHYDHSVVPRMVRGPPGGSVTNRGSVSTTQGMAHSGLVKVSNHSSMMTIMTIHSTILDISNPDPSFCHSFQASVGGIPARLFLLEERANVATIVHSGMPVWNGNNGQRCSFCVAFLKDDKPQVVLITVKTSDELFQVFQGLQNGQWQACTNHMTRVNGLKVNKKGLTKMSLDISRGHSTACTAEGDSLTTTFYSSINGYSIETIMDGSTIIWKAESGHSCYLCEYHCRGGSGLLMLHIKKPNILSYSCFEKRMDGVWDGIPYGAFEESLDRMKGKTPDPKSQQKRASLNIKCTIRVY